MLQLGAILSISYHWLPGILKEFSSLYPNIQFEMTVEGFKELEEKIHTNELDCVFVSKYSVPNLPFYPMGKDELMLVTPKNHPLSEKVAVSLSDINNENFVLSSDGLNYETGEIFELNNLTPRTRYRLNEDFATLKMVEQGFGITILPKLLLHNTSFDVCVRSFTEHYSRVLGVAYSKNAEPMLATSKFIDVVKSWSKEHLN
ncbi:LysR family transcriptional regulator substrate-binding protein [Clostridium sp. C105KSO13]|uniref:LysR family transcriptional regulator substrate-binding protein n=1 Tax=Clostridium sp. C105KSO13 TaxID=1776045 RepID=UPI000B7C9121|nr:LysR family transcriptional regulator substrate-binding protein [Clostridium sp. C105KSO13]